MENPIVKKAIELYLADIGEDGCIGDASCECFACLLRNVAIEIDREIESDFGDYEHDLMVIRDHLEQVMRQERPRKQAYGGQQAYGQGLGTTKVTLKYARETAKLCCQIITRSLERRDTK